MSVADIRICFVRISPAGLAYLYEIKNLGSVVFAIIVPFSLRVVETAFGFYTLRRARQARVYRGPGGTPGGIEDPGQLAQWLYLIVTVLGDTIPPRRHPVDQVQGKVSYEASSA